MNGKLISILVFFVLFALSVNGQEKPVLNGADQLQKQLSVYQAEHPGSNLYLHLDKNIYSPEESIWFKAYLLGDTVTDNKVLYVRLTNEDKETVLSGQFPMYDIRAHGSISLYMESLYGDQANEYTRTHGDIYIDMPKALDEGRYTLYAYTDRMLSYGDTNVFVQPIRIRKKIGRKLEAEAGVSDTAQLVRGSKVQIVARVKESGRLTKNVDGEYELTAGEKTIKYGRLSTNDSGEAFINFTYPKLADEQSLKVKLLFTRGNDYAELSLNLPHEGNPLKINIHPEGGQLLAGVAGKVAIEALDIHGNPVETELLIKNAGQLLEKVKTNMQGIATISLKPETDARYMVETTGKKQQTIPFPPVIKAEGYSLKLNKSKGQCRVIIYNKNQNGDALLILRSAKAVLWSKPITVAAGDSLNVAVPAAEFPKNILSLAVFDQENRLQGERLFLNREAEDYQVTIQTDQEDYGLQKKIKVTIKISDTLGNPVVANLSVAAIEKYRIDSAGYRNILQSWYYRPFGPTNRNRFLSVKSIGEMEGLLRISRWNNNSWNKISTYKIQGPPLRLDYTDGAIGQVLPVGKKRISEIYIHSPEVDISLTKMNKGNIFSFRRVAIKLDENNMFFVPASSLLSRKGKEWTLEGVYKETNHLLESNFHVHWKDIDVKFDSTIVNGKLLYSQESLNRFVSIKSPRASDFDLKKVNQLEEVIIGAKEIIIKKRLRDQCPDWICGACGYLNCPYRPKYRPVKGETYTYSQLKNDKKTVYRNRILYLGCGNFRDINYIKNITIPEEFPLPDYDAVPSEKEDTRSTIYWNPNIVTDANGTATFSFFTSDIQGEFELIAQGLEVNTFKPLMGTGSFKVTTVTDK